jgi:hypothetical protein
MNRLILYVSGFLFLMPIQRSFAENEMDSALQSTQECLKNQNCDAAATGEGKVAAQNALAAVQGNSEKTKELYSISAQLLPILLQQSGGDPTTMQTIVHKAQANPEAFLQSLPADMQARIKKVANDLEKNQDTGLNP